MSTRRLPLPQNWRALESPRGQFDRERLPEPTEYYARELGKLKGAGPWKTAICPFHKDTSPSLSVKLETGAFRCFACGASGGDLIAFIRQRDGLGFIEACKRLGCWVESQP